MANLVTMRESVHPSAAFAFVVLEKRLMSLTCRAPCAALVLAALLSAPVCGQPDSPPKLTTELLRRHVQAQLDTRPTGLKGVAALVELKTLAGLTYQGGQVRWEVTATQALTAEQRTQVVKTLQSFVRTSLGQASDNPVSIPLEQIQVIVKTSDPEVTPKPVRQVPPAAPTVQYYFVSTSCCGHGYWVAGWAPAPSMSAGTAHGVRAAGRSARAAAARADGALLATPPRLVAMRAGSDRAVQDVSPLGDEQAAAAAGPTPTLVPPDAKADDAPRFFSRGYHYYWQGDHEAALAHLEVAVVLNDQDARYWLYKALAERALGDERAPDSVRRAAELQQQSLPGSQHARSALERVQGPEREWLDATLRARAAGR